jgi:hypothetical protein
MFDMSARRFPGLQIVKGGAAHRTYVVPIEVPFYGVTRLVEIRFEDGFHIPKIRAEGPTESPHRYDDGSLCIWYPKDPPEHKWEFADGLLMLINMIQLHLFREEWWRETGGRTGGEWLGPELTHGGSKDEAEKEGDRWRSVAA